MTNSTKPHATYLRKRYREDLVYREQIKKDMCEYRRTNKKHILSLERKRAKELWQQALIFFGPCSCCGEAQIEFLTIDHKNGGGNQRRIRGERGGYRLLAKFKHDGWLPKLKTEYQILCFNCNNAIAYHGKCPHRAKEVVI